MVKRVRGIGALDDYYERKSAIRFLGSGTLGAAYVLIRAIK